MFVYISSWYMLIYVLLQCRLPRKTHLNMDLQKLLVSEKIDTSENYLFLFYYLLFINNFQAYESKGTICEIV